MSWFRKPQETPHKHTHGTMVHRAYKRHRCLEVWECPCGALWLYVGPYIEAFDN